MKLSSVSDYENYVINNMETFAKDYMMNGSQNNVTLHANTNSYGQFRIKRRHMRDVSKTNIETEIFGDTFKMPIGLSPTAMHQMYHPNGELETVEGVKQFDGTVMIVSCGPSLMMEEIATKHPDLVKWFQLFIFDDRSVTLDLVRRAENLGFKALVLTIDCPVWGLKFNSKNVSVFEKVIRMYEKNLEGGDNFRNYTTLLRATDVTWNDLKWLKTCTNLPIVVKGVLTSEDARLAVISGADALMVSNHGGRQLDECPATFEALPEVVGEVGEEIPVFIDGGIRTGNDVFKALALGAKFVFIGRPAIFGLFHSGSTGVQSILEILYNELNTAMKLSGCTHISQINRSNIEHVECYRNKF